MLSCGHEPSPHNEHATGTAHMPDGSEVCWDCADASQRAQMTTGAPFVGYLASDGQSITTWSGGKLARVTGNLPRKVGFRGVMSDRRHYLRAIDDTGKRWHGTSPGPGMYARMRPSK